MIYGRLKHTIRGLLMVGILAILAPSLAADSSPTPETADTYPINFVAIGDSGYETPWFSFFGSWYGVRATHWAPGKSGLPVMAPLLKAYCQANDCQFGVMLGDNIYPGGVDGVDNREDQKRFDKAFIQPFAPLLENNPAFRIFPALGNHDWRGKRKGALAQVEFLRTTPPFDMRGLFYSVKPTGTNGKVEIFVIDTEMILSTLTVYDHNLNDDGSEARDVSAIDDPIEHTKPVTKAEKNQLVWLEQALNTSTADWKIVIGHHPLWSSGSTKFEQSHTLRAAILPTLCKYADAYFAGHEHTEEVHTDSCETVMPEGEAKPLLNIVSGAFSKSRPLHAKFKAYQDATYPQLNSQYVSAKVPGGQDNQYMQTWGFAHISLHSDTATVRMITHIEDSEATEDTELKPDFECVFTKNVGFDKDGCKTP